MNMDYLALGRRIRQFRKEKGLTQVVLAEMIGMEPSNISHIERGATKVGLNTLVCIANALGCSLDDLACDSLMNDRESYNNEIVRLTHDCTQRELSTITDMISCLKQSLRQRYR